MLNHHKNSNTGVTYSFRIICPYFFLIHFIFVLPSSAYRYALLIGSNQGDHTVSTLQYAEKDVLRLEKVLTQHGGISKENSYVLLAPSPKSVDSVFSILRKKLKNHQSTDPTLVLFYYSGHADEKSLFLGNQYYSLEKVKDKLSGIPARIQIGIFDACQSGSIAQLKGGKLGLPFYLQTTNTIQGQIFIASSTANEKSQESQVLESSIFTHHWINALKGNADFSNDRRITVNEAYQYAYQKTIETSAMTNAGIQHPSFHFKISGDGDVVLTDLNSTKTGVTFTPDTYGKILLLSKDYSQVLGDFFKKQGTSHFLAVAPGEYTAVKIVGTETRFFPFTVTEKRIVSLYSNQFIENPLTLTRLKGSNTLASQHLEYTSAPLDPLSVSFGTGSYYKKSSTLLNERPRLFGLKIQGQKIINKNWDFIFYANSMLPGANFALGMGFDRYWTQLNISPYIGGSLGFNLFYQQDFWDDFGPSLEIHPGVKIPLSQRVHLNLQLPYRITYNSNFNQTFGVEVHIQILSLLQSIQAYR